MAMQVLKQQIEHRHIEALIRAQRRTPIPGMRIYQDTTDFMKLDSGDILVLGNNPFFIVRNEKEVGFGMDGDPKYWVKKTIDLTTGKNKIVKLVFFEEFTQKIGDINIRFYRSPLKEARVLEAVRDHPLFMQGFSIDDAVGNNVRIIDWIQGPSLNKLVTGVNMSHERFFQARLFGILSGICDCLQSLSYLHDNGFVHGDVRWDHILYDRYREIYRWIDFDYNYDFPENPFGADLFGVGKILAYVLGKGGFFYSDIKSSPKFEPVVGQLRQEDFSILEQNRLMNLRKIYPYIPERLNNVLLHFSGYAKVFYESVDEILYDLRDALRDL